jgi:hypothetical protein
MKSDTKIYSDFLKRNNINTKGNVFVIANDSIQVYSDNKGWWYDIENKSIIQEGAFTTKKAALYYCCKNHYKNQFI